MTPANKRALLTNSHIPPPLLRVLLAPDFDITTLTEQQQKLLAARLGADWAAILTDAGGEE